MTITTKYGVYDTVYVMCGGQIRKATISKVAVETKLAETPRDKAGNLQFWTTVAYTLHFTPGSWSEEALFPTLDDIVQHLRKTAY